MIKLRKGDSVAVYGASTVYLRILRDSDDLPFTALVDGDGVVIGDCQTVLALMGVFSHLKLKHGDSLLIMDQIDYAC